MSTDDTIIRQAYRDAAQAQPGPQLDAHILQAAHAALETNKKNPARKKPRWSWLVLPFSAAAVAILVTSLVLQLRQTPDTPSLESASAPATSAAKPPEQTVAAAPPEIKTPAPARRDARQDRAAQVASAEHAQQERQRSERDKQAADETQAKQKADLKIAAAPQPAPSIAQPMAEADSAAVGAAAVPPPLAAKPAAPPAERLADAEPRPARESKLEAFSSLAKARGPDKPSDKQLEDIRKLQREGKLDAAKKALAELRKQFPNFKLPEDLRGLIEPAAEAQK